MWKVVFSYLTPENKKSIEIGWGFISEQLG
jgi:hypothetical protein